MNWSKLKQEIYPVLFLSFLNAGLAYNMPLYTEGKVITIIFLSIAGFFFTAHMFMTAPDFKSTLAHLYDTDPVYGSLRMYAHISSLTAVAFVIWYFDCYGISNSMYCALYAFIFLFMYLHRRACYR